MNKLIIILCATLVAVSVWLLMFIGMGDIGNALVEKEGMHSILKSLMMPFEIITVIGFWGGNIIALMMVIVGCFAITKDWGRKWCSIGKGLLITFLVGFTGEYFLIMLSDVSRFLSWFVVQVVPILCVAYFLTFVASRRIAAIK